GPGGVPSRMDTACPTPDATPPSPATAVPPAVADLGPDTPLPEDVPTLQALVRGLLAEVARLRAENAELKGKLDAALRHRFGRRSERRPKPPAPGQPRPGKAAPHGRGQLPEHLERRATIHDLTEAERL